MPARWLPGPAITGAKAQGPPSGGEPTCLPILPATADGWPQLAVGLWDLDSSAWADRHPFDEVNYVLEGRLVVHCDGERLEAGPGETIQVFAGSSAYYSASGHARMLYVYGPNPDGAPSEVLPARSDPGPTAPPAEGTNRETP